MLLATPGQTTTYACHQSTIPINTSGTGNTSNTSSINSKSHKFGRSTYKLIESSQNSGTKGTTTATTTQAILMKTISVRGSRSSGFHSATQSLPANSIKSVANVPIGDNVALVNCVKKAIANHGSNSKSNVKPTSSVLSSSSTTNGKSGGNGNTNSSSSSSSSSSLSSTSLTKVVVTAAFLKTYTVPPTELHRSSAARSRSYSHDSLYDEMCHFKPIKAAPPTPWKCGSRSRGITIKEPKACFRPVCSSYFDFKKSRARQNTKRQCSKSKSKIEPKLSANLFPHFKPHPSAFVNLLFPMGCYTIPSSSQSPCLRLPSSRKPKTKRQTKPSKTSREKTKKKYIKKKTAKKESKKTTKAENTAKTSKVTNTKKRKSQTQTKKCESKAPKKPKMYVADRKTPPLTRRRIRLDESCKLYGPLV